MRTFWLKNAKNSEVLDFKCSSRAGLLYLLLWKPKSTQKRRWPRNSKIKSAKMTFKLMQRNVCNAVWSSFRFKKKWYSLTDFWAKNKIPWNAVVLKEERLNHLVQKIEQKNTCNQIHFSKNNDKSPSMVRFVVMHLSSASPRGRTSGWCGDFAYCAFQNSCISPPVGDFFLAKSPVLGEARHPTGLQDAVQDFILVLWRVNKHSRLHVLMKKWTLISFSWILCKVL